MAEKNRGEQVLTKTRAAVDREIAAMSRISRVLAELGEDELRRVVIWIGEKYAEKKA